MTTQIKLNKINVWRLKHGDKVELPDGVFTVDKVSNGLGSNASPCIEFTDRGEDGHWFVVGPEPTYLHSRKPLSPSTPQTRKVLKLLERGHLTRLTAMHYGVMNLTARIADLRNLGWTVDCNVKRDSEGNRYGRFTLAAEHLV